MIGLRIIRDIVNGQRDPEPLAAHRDRRCQASHAEIVEALTGSYRVEHVFVLQQHLALYDACQMQITACDAVIASHLQALTAALPPVS